MMDEATRTRIINAVKPHELAEMLVDRLPDEAQYVDPVGGYPVFSINSEYVPVIAECLLEIVAYTVSTLIDAGSERDAVMENEEIASTLERELSGWTEMHAMAPATERDPLGERMMQSRQIEQRERDEADEIARAMERNG